ncbi:CTP synthase (glutamine hydrolyzing) [Methanonatronarchaeum sp. AMET-Sl]|uniref:glutamine hydrolyzing CTP synthase n=1 Tax=Methanonatronarchaeum sp. AMET-Sl TaxID=3037654 RepID=UPI00244DC03E|nr:CTP synthase (glutamine hydrolyzing) [Methanonatronarchaeum sp. AMET-Sl]WGI17568.1 CTP synthase (glutamine hydrolyzing) [Methanonatronarchaeum sp. AMET-Sl]
MNYIIVTGGVMSGIGKGITAASIGRILKERGFDVTAIKIDPYLNVDAGTMSPFQHGEVFVLKDGGEVDLDLGNYERFLNTELTSEHNITTGKVYRSVINKERNGNYLGRTVQIIPHITNEIKERIRNVSDNSYADICLIELGGTVGDIEGMPFLEATRQLINEEGPNNVMLVHVTLVPVLEVVGEQKTKPTQHSVKELRELGLHPDMVVGRCKEPLNKKTKNKIALFCDVPEKAVISAHDANDIYEVPLQLEQEEATDIILNHLNLQSKQKDMEEWRKHVKNIQEPNDEIKIALVGKYTQLEDAYMSVTEALKHAAAEEGLELKIKWINAEKLEQQNKQKIKQQLQKTDGIVVPGGFGKRGSEGKIKAIEIARTQKIPFLGLCFGFQLAVIEFARNVLQLENCGSSEIMDNLEEPVIDILPEQKNIESMGGTMRLGNQTTIIEKQTLAHQIYQRTKIIERHRHRYEVNPEYIPQLEKHGMKFSGKEEKTGLIEILEIPNHPYYLGTQFHPEFKSRLENPSPPFQGLIKTANKNKNPDPNNSNKN